MYLASQYFTWLQTISSITQLLQLLILSSDSQIADFNAPKKNLTFMLMTSFGQYGFNSSGFIPAADMAIQDINRNSHVLPGYSLNYDVLRDSQV